MKKFHNQSIKIYLISISVIFTLVITFLVASFSYYSFNTLLSKSLIQSTSFNLNLASETISRDMLPIISFSKWCETNIALSKYIETASDMEELKNIYINIPLSSTKDSYENANDSVKIQSLISWKRLLEEYRNNRSSSYIERIIVSSHYGNYLQFSPISTYHSRNIYTTITELPIFDTQLNANTIEWTGLEKNPFNTTTNELIIPIIRPIYGSYNNDVIGWSYITVSSSIITNTFKSYDLPDDSLLFVTINQHTYQIKDHQLLEVFLDDTITTGTSPRTSEIRDQNGTIHNIISVESSLDGWIFSQTLSLNQFNEQKKVYYLLLIFISFIVLFLGFVLAFFLSRKINKPIDQLKHKMDLISSGHFSRDPNIEWNNELGSIGKGINNLAENVVILMDKRIEDEKEKSELEYQVLQSQINPHFLYNTLNSIKWMASIQNADGIAEMITALSKLLRSVSKDTKQIHALKDEIGLLDHYFLIQKYRYGGSLSLHYNIEDPSLLNCLIPKFTLQPIVENAIFHGIEPKGSIGEIIITVFTENDTVLAIDIHDNGIGMTPEQIRDVLSPAADSRSDFFKKIGINNVNKRIQHAFGASFGLSIVSALDTGTTMKIRLQKGDYHD